MTKDEIIDYIIERYKELKNNGVTWSISLYNCCQGIDCDNCPFDDADCTEDVAMSILERLVKVEEHQETNFDHYINNYFLVRYDNEVKFKLKDGWEESFCDFWSGDFREWLKSPYEEPKPKYKLNHFEYDLLDSVAKKWMYIRDEDVLGNFTILVSMIDKGYFKDISPDVLIKDILNNCEVVKE